MIPGLCARELGRSPNFSRNRGANRAKPACGTVGGMATLVRYRLGRILLHLAAMIGDGALRFHAAGILRELRLQG